MVNLIPRIFSENAEKIIAGPLFNNTSHTVANQTLFETLGNNLKLHPNVETDVASLFHTNQSQTMQQLHANLTYIYSHLDERFQPVLLDKTGNPLPKGQADKAKYLWNLTGEKLSLSNDESAISPAHVDTLLKNLYDNISDDNDASLKQAAFIKVKGDKNNQFSTAIENHLNGIMPPNSKGYGFKNANQFNILNWLEND